MRTFKVLIVDDEDDIRSLIAGIVRSAVDSVTIVEARDGVEGATKMYNMKFDLVISDVNMPKAKGTSLVQESLTMPAIQRPDHFILVSGDDQAVSTYKKMGKVAFIPKPFDARSFSEFVKKTLYGEVEAEAHPQSKPVDVTPKLDVSFINPFIDSTLQVLETMAGTKATKERVFIRKGDEVSGDISAIVAMNSNKFLGSMAVSFQESCFLSVVNNMLGETFTSINAENQDAAAELCNQIFGSAKKVLNSQGHTIEMAIPSVVTGKAHKIKHMANGVCIVVSFTTDAGSFTVEAVVELRK